MLKKTLNVFDLIILGIGAVVGTGIFTIIGSYLYTLPAEARNTFVGRYYFADPIREVADYYGMSEPKVKSMLYRTRQGLKEYLEKEGYEL